MLTNFAVTNYRGFRDKIEWNLSNPSNYSFNDFAIQNGVIKNGIIYGPNGSGKSNLGLAIFDIANHLYHKWKESFGQVKKFIYFCTKLDIRPWQDIRNKQNYKSANAIGMD